MLIINAHSDADLNLNRNIFLETALGYALSYIAAVASPVITPAEVTILADNDYYSTSASFSNDCSKSKPRFQNFRVPISKAHKTGLGSSAALVTAFTAAVLTHYLSKEDFDISTDLHKRRLHNLAQAAHCAAQGKVGSGFDVASAVYGSCLYRRFSPSILLDFAETGATGFATQLRHVVEETGKVGRWDTEIRKEAVKVPKSLRLVMCDVSCGSQTPGMVKKVLAWRKTNPEEANAIWTDLHHANESLAKELKAISESGSLGLDRLKQCFVNIRRNIRLMSDRSGVPIEPPAQTELIDACEKVPGVIGGTVPGAGGYDAIALLIEDKESTVSDLQQLLSGWKFKSDGGGADIGGIVSMLGVREEMEGVRKEDAAAYKEWLISA